MLEIQRLHQEIKGLQVQEADLVGLFEAAMNERGDTPTTPALQSLLTLVDTSAATSNTYNENLMAAARERNETVAEECLKQLIALRRERIQMLHLLVREARTI